MRHPAATATAATAQRKAYLFVLGWDLVENAGVDQVVLNLFDQCKRDGTFVPLCHVPSWEPGKTPVEDVDGRTTFRLRLFGPWQPGGPLRLLRFLALLPKTLLAIRRLVKSEHIAVVNPHFCGLEYLNYTIARWLGLIDSQVILSFHNSDLRIIPDAPRLVRWMFRCMVAQADAVTGPSDAVKRDLDAIFPRYVHKIHAVHNGIDSRRFLASVSAMVPSDLPKRFILCIAILDPHKGHDVLIRSFAAIVPAHPDVSLVIIGTRAEAAADIERLIRDLSLEQRVRLTGRIPHEMVGRYLERAEIFTLPSRREGLPIAILEAGAYGKPVVATAVDGIPEVIEHGKTGRLVAPDDVEGLARELDFLLTDRVAAQRLGEALKLRIAKHFTWEAAYDKYLALSAASPSGASATRGKGSGP